MNIGCIFHGILNLLPSSRSCSGESCFKDYFLGIMINKLILLNLFILFVVLRIQVLLIDILVLFDLITFLTSNIWFLFILFVVLKSLAFIFTNKWKILLPKNFFRDSVDFCFIPVQQLLFWSCKQLFHFHYFENFADHIWFWWTILFVPADKIQELKFCFANGDRSNSFILLIILVNIYLLFFVIILLFII